MSDKEIAIRIIEKQEFCKEEDVLAYYFQTIEAIRNYKSKNIIGKLEELFYDYDHKSCYCDFDKSKFIDNVRNLLKESENN